MLKLKQVLHFRAYKIRNNPIIGKLLKYKCAKNYSNRDRFVKAIAVQFFASHGSEEFVLKTSILTDWSTCLHCGRGYRITKMT